MLTAPPALAPAVLRDGRVLPYEQRLNENRRWALSEGSRHFEGGSEVERALAKVTARLDDLEIPYALVGGMALFLHGLRRFTEDVDILVTREGLDRIHANLRGRGYLPPFEKSRHLRDTESGVRIEFLVTGAFPGKGVEIPVSFPDPADVATEIDGVRCVRLETLVELKLASGKDNPGRLKDLADVQEMVKAFDLPRDFADRVNPYVRTEFLDQWDAARSAVGQEEL